MVSAIQQSIYNRLALVQRQQEQEKKGALSPSLFNVEIAGTILRQELSAFSSRAILAELRRRHRAGTLAGKQNRGDLRFLLVRAAAESTSPKHARALAGLLLWDEVALERDRSSRSHIHKALRRVGGPAVVPILVKAAEKAKLIKYRSIESEGEFFPASYYYELDAEDFSTTIEACQSRA